MNEKYLTSGKGSYLKGCSSPSFVGAREEVGALFIISFWRSFLGSGSILCGCGRVEKDPMSIRLLYPRPYKIVISLEDIYF